MDNNEKIEIIMETYSFEQQREIFVEECAEAIQAVQKLKRSDHTNYINKRETHILNLHITCYIFSHHNHIKYISTCI